MMLWRSFYELYGLRPCFYNFRSSAIWVEAQFPMSSWVERFKKQMSLEEIVWSWEHEDQHCNFGR